MNDTPKERLMDFLKKNHPGVQGVLLCKQDTKTVYGKILSRRYYCIEQFKDGNETTYIINGNPATEYDIILFGDFSPKVEILFKQS